MPNKHYVMWTCLWQVSPAFSMMSSCPGSGKKNMSTSYENEFNLLEWT